MSEWCYSNDLSSHEQVSEQALTELIKSGQLHGETLIWREGMTNWQKIRESQFAEILQETGVCAASGRIMPKSEMLQYGEHWIDPEEKENFVAGMMENGRTPITFNLPAPILSMANYQSPVFQGSLAKWLILIYSVVSLALSTTTLILTFAMGNDLGWLLILGLLNVMTFLIYIPAVVFYCIWLYRCSANTCLIGDQKMKHTPGMMVGWYFIPIVQLWMPYFGMRDLWRIMNREGSKQSVTLVDLWWGVWVGLTAITVLIIFFASMDGYVDNIVQNVITTLISIFQMIAAILIFKIVTSITDRQVELWENPETPT